MTWPHFRYEVLEVWRDASDLAAGFLEVARRLDGRRLHRDAGRLRSAGLAAPNRVAEASATPLEGESLLHLGVARHSTAGLASMVPHLERMDLLRPGEADALLDQTDRVARRLAKLIRRLSNP